VSFARAKPLRGMNLASLQMLGLLRARILAEGCAHEHDCSGGPEIDGEDCEQPEDVLCEAVGAVESAGRGNGEWPGGGEGEEKIPAGDEAELFCEFEVEEAGEE